MFSKEIQRRSSEELDLVEIFMKDLREISFFRRSQKRFGYWVINLLTFNIITAQSHFLAIL
jgi:hypothetical protein